ncbi:MAG TPA: ABC transporter permease [Acidimicrobiales bacterium]|jgi:peptide/nickel transport system permease protein
MSTLHEGVPASAIVPGPSPTSNVADFEAGREIVPLWKQRLRIFLHNRLAVASVIFLMLVLLFCYAGPLIYHTNQTNQAAALNQPFNSAPSAKHLLGTDSSGFDELGRIMFGGEYSLSLGMLAGVITIVVGTLYGMIAGFLGGIVDTLMMRLLDAFLSIPLLFLLITLISVFSRSTVFLIVIIGVTGWFGNARIIRGDALLIKKLEYSQAATAMGASKWHIIRRHVFPNSMSNIVTVATFSVADAILFLSTLGFLGLGIPAPQTDWGTMLQNGSVQQSNGYWWEIYPTALMFVLVIVAITYVGEALRDAFEVRLLER